MGPAATDDGAAGPMSGATHLKFAPRAGRATAAGVLDNRQKPGIFDRPASPCYDAPIASSPRRLIDTETVYYSTTRESPPMQKPLHLQTTVLPGGKIVIVDQDLAEGETVEIFVTAASPTPRRSAVEVLAESPGHRLFKTPQDVTDYLESERASWEH